MSGLDGHWKEAFDFMKNGGPMPDHLKKLIDDPPRIIVPFVPYGRPGVGRTHYLPAPRNLMSRDDALNYIARGPIQASSPDQSARQHIDDIERKLLATFDDLPDSFTDRVGQSASQQSVDATLRQTAKLFSQGPFGPSKPHGTYVDPDGTQHLTELLEDRPEGELCMTCGASWRCEHT